jgi:hypothetical protein
MRVCSRVKPSRPMKASWKRTPAEVCQRMRRDGGPVFPAHADTDDPNGLFGVLAAKKNACALISRARCGSGLVSTPPAPSLRALYPRRDRPACADINAGSADFGGRPRAFRASGLCHPPRPGSRNDARPGTLKFMTRFQDHLRDPTYLQPIRTKLGEALREQYNLMDPTPPSLPELLSKLENSAHVRDITRGRLYAEIDECVAALVNAANRKPREPGDAGSV